MYDTTGTPIAWVAEWVGPHEGGMTLAMKYAWANSLNGAAASKSICGKSLVQSHSQRQHGRSFLVPGWSRIARLNQQPTIGALIAKRDMSRYVGRWGQQLASDTHIRYCPECIQFGYQSLLFQIDALTCCPLHRTALLSACRRCSAPTPRYALTAEAMEAPFCCPSCGAAYGQKFDPRAWKCLHLHGQVEKTLLPLVRFLLEAKRAKIDWVHWQEWFGPWLGEVEEREKRIATCTVLRRIVPTSGLNEEMFLPPARQLSVSMGRVSGTMVPQSLGTATDPQTRRQIYKSIRRHLFKLLPRHVVQRQLLFPGQGEVELRNEILWLSLKKCPYLQAVWLWRLRFEQAQSVVFTHPSRNRQLSFLEIAQNWPWQGAGDDSVWAHYVLAGFHAAAEIVCEWWKRASTLAAAADPDRAHSMELYVEFANLLSPSRLPVPPRVAAVFETRPPGKGAIGLHVVGPTSGLEKLLACCRCGSSRSKFVGNPGITPL
jgi:hypothetical protein